MKYLKYKFQPGSLHEIIQSLQNSAHAQKDENWSGDWRSPRYLKRRLEDPI